MSLQIAPGSVPPAPWLTSGAAARVRERERAEDAGLAARAQADPAFARDVLAGLAQARKSIPCTWLYDRRGSALFERITEQPEYYLARTETWLLRCCAPQIAAAAGRGARVIELGSGSCRKTQLLLAALDAPAAYVSVDLSAEFLAESAAALRACFPALRVEPLVADFTRLDRLPLLRPAAAGRPLVFFPGSTIGNLMPEDAVDLLARIARAAGDDALLVIGADATQDPALLLPAYDDRAGVTAAFNKNLLARINRELGGDFDLAAFDHVVRWDARQQRVEMHLASRREQSVRVLGQRFDFAAGEALHTENAYKHGPLKLRAMVARAGWVQRQFWMDGHGR